MGNEGKKSSFTNTFKEGEGFVRGNRTRTKTRLKKEEESKIAASKHWMNGGEGAVLTDTRDKRVTALKAQGLAGLILLESKVTESVGGYLMLYYRESLKYERRRSGVSLALYAFQCLLSERDVKYEE